MKKHILISMISILAINFSLIAQMDQKQLFEHKIQQYKKTRNAGRILTFSGIGVTAIGTGFLVSYISDQANYSYDEEFGAKYFAGVYGTALGIDMIIGGIILSAVGSHKIKQYSKKLDNLSLGVICTPDKRGICLTYRF
jgi:hypothetical protein